MKFRNNINIDHFVTIIKIFSRTSVLQEFFGVPNIWFYIFLSYYIIAFFLVSIYNIICCNNISLNCKFCSNYFIFFFFVVLTMAFTYRQIQINKTAKCYKTHNLSFKTNNLIVYVSVLIYFSTLLSHLFQIFTVYCS